MRTLQKHVFSLAEGFFELFYPRLCAGCDTHLMKGESDLCLRCMADLPRTYYWDYDITPVDELFFGRLKVGRACSFLHFTKGSSTQRMLHRLKYEGKREVGTALGAMFGARLKERNFFPPIDRVIPIPLHPAKEQRRGYNQSLYIARGLADALGSRLDARSLVRTEYTESQTRKGRFERAENVEEVFACVRPELIRGRSVLLVDDVVTTGATLEAAGRVLLDKGARVLHIAAIAGN